jgi:isopentenyl-diphosphate delta-isomerase
MEEELVVLVDEQDQVVGSMPKSQVHTDHTPLHRGLSVYVFDDQGNVIVQQRADHKKTWPGVWSNSCCGHPQPGEPYETAAAREVKEELGVDVVDLKKVGDYRYRFEKNGVVEHEICPVFSSRFTGEVRLDPREVKEWKWMTWTDFLATLAADQDDLWSPWAKEEVKLFTA